MGKLAHIKRQLRQVDKREKEALDRSLNKAVSEGITPSIKAVQDALYAHTVAVKETQGVGTAKAVKAVEHASAALSRAVDGLVEHVSGIESQILAEIRAIKFPEMPESKETDLSPVLEAIRGIPQPEKVEFPEVSIPEFPEIPKPKAIVPIRNRNTSLVERYELEY